jgi:photosystem II stability/assembly factor-like uncharacterized protein
MSIALLIVAVTTYGGAPAAFAAEAVHPSSAAFEHVHALGFDSAARSLWLGTHAGLFRSEDSGRTWAKVSLPVNHDGPDIMAVTPDPEDAGTVYVATHEAGVFKTTDGGRTWAEVNSGLGGHDVHGIAIDPKAKSKLHALVRDKNQGLYRSTNGAQKWVRVDDGPGGETKVLASVNIPTGMGGIFLYAGTAEGLQRSPDCF